jgi:undecaprenyl pyrophosphate phosphatase UppP
MGWELLRMEGAPPEGWAPLLLGMAVSAVVGAASLWYLLSVIEKRKLHLFAAYCLPAGAVFFTLGMLGVG